MSRAGHADYDSANATVRAAWESELRDRGRVTNMKRTLLLSEPAYAAYMGWYPLWDALKAIVGERAASVFAHAISAQNACVLCTLYFRRELAQAGITPETYAPLGGEALLVELAQAMAQGAHAIPEALWQRLKGHFSNAEIVTIIGFAGMMTAVNVFNSTLGVDVDKDLEAFLPAEASAPVSSSP